MFWTRIRSISAHYGTESDPKVYEARGDLEALASRDENSIIDTGLTVKCISGSTAVFL